MHVHAALSPLCTLWVSHSTFTSTDIHACTCFQTAFRGCQLLPFSHNDRFHDRFHISSLSMIMMISGQYQRYYTENASTFQSWFRLESSFEISYTDASEWALACSEPFIWQVVSSCRLHANCMSPFPSKTSHVLICCFFP
jgi:hypothetical protein